MAIWTPKLFCEHWKHMFHFFSTSYWSTGSLTLNSTPEAGLCKKLHIGLVVFKQTSKHLDWHRHSELHFLYDTCILLSCLVYCVPCLSFFLKFIYLGNWKIESKQFPFSKSQGPRTSMSPWKAAWCSTPELRIRRTMTHLTSPESLESECLTVLTYLTTVKRIWKRHTNHVEPEKDKIKQVLSKSSICPNRPCQAWKIWKQDVPVQTCANRCKSCTDLWSTPWRVAEGRVFTTFSGLLKPFNNSKVASLENKNSQNSCVAWCRTCCMCWFANRALFLC